MVVVAFDLGRGVRLLGGGHRPIWQHLADRAVRMLFAGQTPPKSMETRPRRGGVRLRVRRVFQGGQG